jgi:multidrug transporter EmrE-like cation transporter
LITQAIHGVDPRSPLLIGPAPGDRSPARPPPAASRRLTTSELALVVLSAFLHAIWSASIKGSRNPLGFNLLQLVPPVTAACLLPFWVPLGDVPRAVWWIAIGTGVSHGFYFYWLARALASGELSVVYPIARSAPAFLPLFAVLLLGESVTVRGALGIAVVVAGMWAVQADAGVVGWQRFRAPGAKFAWLTLLASIGYSLCDKAAMARLNAATWHSAVPPAVVYYVLLSVAGGWCSCRSRCAACRARS